MLAALAQCRCGALYVRRRHIAPGSLVCCIASQYRAGVMATPGAQGEGLLKELLLSGDIPGQVELLLNLLSEAAAGRDISHAVSEVIQVCRRRCSTRMASPRTPAGTSWHPPSTKHIPSAPSARIARHSRSCITFQICCARTAAGCSSSGQAPWLLINVRHRTRRR